MYIARRLIHMNECTRYSTLCLDEIRIIYLPNGDVLRFLDGRCEMVSPDPLPGGSKESVITTINFFSMMATLSARGGK